MALNSVSLVGRLTADPTTRKVGNDLTVCNFTLAVDKRGKNRGTNFIDCTAWGKTGETIAQYVKKGQQLGVSGSLNQDSWEKDGNKFTKLGVMVNDFTFLSTVKRQDSNEEKSGDSSQQTQIDWDVPF